jgi:hypothetical protein
MAAVNHPDPAAATCHGAPARQAAASARRAALFASGLQRSDAPTATMAAEAITATVRRFGIHGCVSRMAQEFGDHPDAAAERMRWICQLPAEMPAWPQMPAGAGRPGGRAGNETEARSDYRGAATVGSLPRAQSAPPGMARCAVLAGRWLERG